jgi:hypothetical protein
MAAGHRGGGKRGTGATRRSVARRVALCHKRAMLRRDFTVETIA